MPLGFFAFFITPGGGDKFFCRGVPLIAEPCNIFNKVDVPGVFSSGNAEAYVVELAVKPSLCQNKSL